MSWRWLNEYITAAGIAEDDSKGPLFRAAAGKRKRLTSAGYTADFHSTDLIRFLHLFPAPDDRVPDYVYTAVKLPETREDCARDSQCHRIWHMASSTGIKLTIDKSGRIVVPKPLRERLGLKPGTELEVLDQPGGVLLRTVEERPALVKIDGMWVHRGVAQPGANWDRVIQEVREERIESVLKA